MRRSIPRSIPALGASVLAALFLASQPAPAGAEDFGGLVETDITVSFDIQPTTCPNLFNPSSPVFLLETLTTAILGNDSLDVNDIDESSLLIVVPSGGGGVRCDTTYIAPIETGYEDVAAPLVDPEYCECHTEGPDEHLDITVYFDADEVAAALGYVEGGQEIQLCIIGELLNGTTFGGCDCILIDGTVPVDQSSWGKAKAQFR